MPDEERFHAASPDVVTPATSLIALHDAEVVRNGAAILHVESLVFNEGEHVAILGPNGAGKSTLIGLITREVRPLARERPPVLLRGTARWDLFEARRIFGVVSDALQADYARGVTVRDVILSGYFGSIGLYRQDEVTTAMDARVDQLAALLEIEPLIGRTMDTLSTGEARRALIGRALVRGPALLVLDEPTHGLDPSGTHAFLDLLRQLAEQTALVIVTHHVSDIVPEVTRVVMLKDGRVVRDGPKRELLTSEALSELYAIPTTLEERDGWYRLW